MHASCSVGLNLIYSLSSRLPPPADYDADFISFYIDFLLSRQLLFLFSYHTAASRYSFPPSLPPPCFAPAFHTFYFILAPSLYLLRHTLAPPLTLRVAAHFECSVEARRYYQAADGLIILPARKASFQRPSIAFDMLASPGIRDWLLILPIF